ncbi:alpha-2-macroglobulin family protein [Colwellia sp. D2M02]|uniref:alpha-2-macroglobulin family protein n=1 Tax=Colwellia sp. D2M02 TaxID=2841562 RepID=UPI001C090567|nr:alpha-2-macroglobulin [Colwellia sp. D2M02]MBU2894258.1 alpha-2-macroglobulin family protein [Colwellia sp. D2M02]
MKTIPSTLQALLITLMLALLTLAGCNNDQSPASSTATKPEISSQDGNSTTTSPKNSPIPEATFNLQQVQQDYANVPLTVLDVSERSRNGKNSIAVTLSVPLDPAKDHQKYFNISRKKSGVIDGAWVLSKSGKVAWFSYTEPEKTYDITIYQGLVAANGQRLKQVQSHEVTTNSLTASINFNTTGAFLTQGLGNGLPVVSVNTDSVDINFYRIREKDQQRFLDEMQYNRHYWGVERVTQFGDLAYTGRYELNAPKNTRVERSIDIAGITVLENPGIYLAVMTKAGTYNKQQMMWFSVTDIGLHARFYDNQIDVFASSLTSGKALAQVEISLLNNQGEILQQGLTSPSGQASFTSNLNFASLIIAKSEQHFSVIEIHKPALDLSEFDLGLRPSKPQTLFIYAPRDLYRPGEIINFNALLRNKDGGLISNSILTATIISPDGTQVKTFKWAGNEQSYYHHAWSIPKSAQVGNWQLNVASITDEIFTFDFKVEEFLPERLKLTFNPKNEDKRVVSTKSKPLTVDILGEYLYGAPASGNRLSTEVNVSQWRNPVVSLPLFEFGNSQEVTFNSRSQLSDIELDANGRGSISFNDNLSELNSPLRVQFISSLYESGGRPVSRAYSGLVWPQEKLLGIRSSFGNNNPEANSKVSFDIIKASLDGKKYAANNLDVKLIREDRRYFWVYTDNQGWHYQWNDKEFVELTTTVNIKANESAQVQFPVEWGRYRLEVRDPANNLLTSKQFYAGTNWYEDWQQAQNGSGAAKPDKITMALDKAAYAAGDTVKVKVIPPQAGEAIIMVEGDTPLWMQRISIPSEGSIVEIPLSKAWQQHNLYISAVVLQAGNNIKSITPKRSFGLIHLPLERSSRQLNISVDAPEKSLPNKKLTVKVNVAHAQNATNTTNKSSKAFVTLAAVDVGVLSITDFKTPDPFNAFFGQRRYSVDVRDVYHKVIEISQAEKANLRFGGDSDLTRGGKAPQSDVQIVSLFSGLVTLNDAGEAEIELDIPDFNGQLKLMAVAFTDDEFGHAEQNITIAAPVVTQIAMPRFLAMGDKTTIALDITNLSGAEQVLQVSFSASGAVKALNNSQTITLSNGIKETLTYQVTAQAASGKAQFNLAVTGEKLNEGINQQWQLGLRPAYPATLTKTQKVLMQGEQLSLDLAQVNSLIPETLQASVSIANRADINLQNQLSHLMQYPYGCLEQTSSRVYPLIFASPDKQKLMGIKSVSESERLAMINKGIERLATLQLSNGGYGLWSNTSEEEHWLTAYVGDFLLNARDMGVNVPEALLADTLKRLQRYLAHSGRFYNERWSDDAKHYNFAYKAYAAYVLSRVNQAPLGTLRSLASNHAKEARSGLSQIQLALALANMGDKKRSNTLFASALKNLPKKRTRYLADYGSQVRDLAMMIHLMLKHKQSPEQAIALSFTLAELVNQRQYFSTQERNALFLAGLSLKDNQINNKLWSADLLLNAATASLSQTDAYSQPLPASSLQTPVSITSTNETPLLASISLNGYSKKAPAESANGLAIQRRWLTLKGKEVSIKNVTVGELFLVNLTVNAKQRTPDAMVIDLLPAGFELENQNLAHSIKLDEIMVDGKSISHWQQQSPLKHQEFRDDRFVAALEVYQGHTVQLFYLARAVTPGTYKVPSSLVEDMYRPELRGIGNATPDINVSQPKRK